jgi:hypothetical protein
MNFIVNDQNIFKQIQLHITLMQGIGTICTGQV